MNESLLILALGIFLGFYIQTLIGFGGALVDLPVLISNFYFQDSIAYLTFFYLFSSGYLVKKEWSNINFAFLKTMVISSMIGVAIGILVLRYTKPTFLKPALGFFIIIYVLYKVFVTKPPKLPSKINYILGALGGFFSGVFSTGGPLYVIAVNQKISKVKEFRATMIGILAVVTLTRFPLLVTGGLLDMEHVVNGFKIFPVFILATWLGKLTFDKINKVFLKKLILTLLLISGILIVYKSFY